MSDANLSTEAEVEKAEAEAKNEAMFLPFDRAENLRRMERTRPVSPNAHQVEIARREGLIRNTHVATPDWRRARDEWLPMVAMDAGLMREGQILLISGATKMARTHTFNRLLCHRDLQPFNSDDGLIRPVLILQISGGDWRRPLPFEMLAALSARPGEPAVPERYSAMSLHEARSAAEAQMIAQQVQIVAAEDIHGLRPASGKKDVEEAAETLAWLLLNRTWPVHVLATACTDSDDMLIDCAPALRGRTIRVETSLITDTALVMGIAAQLHEQYGFPRPSPLLSKESVARRLMEKSAGRPGLLIEILIRAAKLARLTNAYCIGLEHLQAAERHVLPPGRAAEAWKAAQEKVTAKPSFFKRLRARSCVCP